MNCYFYNSYTSVDTTVMSNSLTVFTKPNNFYFGVNESGTRVPISSDNAKKKWDVSQKIQTILPGIDDFNDEATKWKKWNA
jgi:hypothetical protein